MNTLCVLGTSILTHAHYSELLRAGRETVSFDYAWRFRRGEPDADPYVAASCASLVPANDVYCPSAYARRCAGNEFSSVQTVAATQCNDTSSATDCEALCCADPGCGMWVWNASEDGSNRCFWSSGQPGTGNCTHQPGWLGGKRQIPGPRMGPRSLAPVSPSYDDFAWEAIDLPHDSRLGEPYDLSMFRGPGKLPFAASWYRKSFRVPSEWESVPLFLTFEGVMRACSIYLNGQLISTHQVGYTAFTVRLDNTGVLLGNSSTNVLAVFADNRFSSWVGTKNPASTAAC